MTLLSSGSFSKRFNGKKMILALETVNGNTRYTLNSICELARCKYQQLLLKVKVAVKGVGLQCIVHNGISMDSLYHFTSRKFVVLLSVTVTIENTVYRFQLLVGTGLRTEL